MILSDRHLKVRLATKSIIVTPMHPTQVRECSIDLKLHSVVKRPKNTGLPISSVNPDVEMETETLGPKQCLTIYPGQFYLGATLEHIEIPDDLCAEITGKSSLARLGLVVHVTAGHVEPGWKGQLTLEMTNLGPSALMLYPGQFVAQIVFKQLTSPCDENYSVKGRYNNSQGPVASKGVGHE